MYKIEQNKHRDGEFMKVRRVTDVTPMPKYSRNRVTGGCFDKSSIDDFVSRIIYVPHHPSTYGSILLYVHTHYVLDV